MTIELAPRYESSKVEPEIAARWNDANAFHADPADPGNPFCVVIPPPNVTGALHMGHALNNTLQDILVRWHRMRGDNTLWMPGTDHAGIATQTVVEKRVLAETGRKRSFFTREEFVAKIQTWKDEYEARILGQLKAMGCSCDWDRTRFTMDPICAKAVREAFFRLFKEGLIYRGKRLVNWDPATETALADDEVEMEEIDGHFYYLRYPIVEEGHGTRDKGHAEQTHAEYITVATTRPETMLGDTAVAINPKDPRAAKLRGKHVRLPIVGRVIPIIEDDYVVLPLEPSPSGRGQGEGSVSEKDIDPKTKYATGFLKVTPAHDTNDWEIGVRHKLPVINVLAPDGSISDQHGWSKDDVGGAEFLLGMDRFEARKAVVEWFRKNGLLEEVKPYRHAVGHSYRSHVPIEPYLSDQWYVKVTDDRLRGAALRAMKKEQRSASGDSSRSKGAAWEGKLVFHPERYARNFEQWHENIRDWCISRQIWWGHRIPVWSKRSGLDSGDWLLTGLNPGESPKNSDEAHRILRDRPIDVIRDAKANGEVAIVRHFDGKDVIVHVCPSNAYAESEWGRGELRELETIGFVQDPDVLDTWFSSALWPISTLSWPDATPELAKWNPSSVLSTSRDIITLWVSRMVMFNLFLRDCLPFTDVFIHATVLDGEGRRMSKSLGNGVDPLDIIHSHGSDAMRYTLAQMTTNTQDVRLPVVKDAATGKNTSDKFDAGRNFANKLWNAVRFALSNLENKEGSTSAAPASNAASQAPSLTLADKWILSRLAAIVRDTNAALSAYDFNSYAQGLYDFIWRDLCDWYIEAVKPTIRTNESQRRVLTLCIDATLRLLHPVMPYITEKLWEKLNDVAPIREISGVALTPSALLVHARWPEVSPAFIDSSVEADFALLQQIVGAIREARTTYKIPPKQKIRCSAKAPAAMAQRMLANRPLAETLANFEGHEIGPVVQKPANAAVAVVAGGVEIYLHDLVDPNAEKARMGKRADELRKNIAALEGRLASKNYTDKAPAHLVQQTRDQLAAAKAELAAVESQH